MSPVLLALILGIVEGLTEFIPVSSTGHLIVVGEMLKFNGEAAATFEVFIQLGAILAVVVLYPKRFADLLNLRNTGSLSGYSGLMKMFFACLPAFVLGFLFHDSIKQILFNPFSVAIALIVGGIAIVAIDREQEEKGIPLENISLKQSFLVGCFQCLALWPGISRSGSTILGGMLVGLQRGASAEFSFLLAVPVMFAAVGYDMYKSTAFLGSEHLVLFSVGFVVSFLSAVLAIRFFLSIISRFSLQPFGYYRIVIGILILLLFPK